MKDFKENIKAILLIMLIMTIGSVFGAQFWHDKAYKKGQKDALRGKYKYEMKIRYESKQDSVNEFIPVDTIFVKLK